jgi:ribosomal protein L7/L12
MGEQIRVLLGQGRKIEAIKVFREATGAGLAEAKEAVEALEKGQDPLSRVKPGDGLESEVLALLEQGKKIEAIKVYRNRSGAGLKDAKDAVEALAKRHNIASPGCAGMLALLFIGGMISLFGLVRDLNAVSNEGEPASPTAGALGKRTQTAIIERKLQRP